MENMLTAKEVAVRLRVKLWVIYQNWREWGIPCVKLGDSKTSRLRFPADRFEKWLRGRLQTNGGLETHSIVDNRVRILKFLYNLPDQCASLDDIVQSIPLNNRGQVYNLIRGLVVKGYIRKVSRGLYELASRGKRYVEEIL